MFQKGDIVELDPNCCINNELWRKHNHISFGKSYTVINTEKLDECNTLGLIVVIDDTGKNRNCFIKRFKYSGEELEPDDVSFY